ncbi:MAG: radical SAM protein [Candidatus Methylacidiphilales bacterium]
MRAPILLIAMSGVRVRDPELLALGLTLPGFVERSRVIASLPSLGLLTLAAHTPEEYEVEYVEWDDLPLDPVTWILERNVGVVAFSCLTARITECYRICDLLKNSGVITVLGGLHVSACPEEALQHAHTVVQGEGELVWSTLVEDWSKGNLQRCYTSFEGGKPSAMKWQPRVPRYDLLDMNRYNRITVQSTRGCPLDCEFCGASRTISRFRKKRVEHLRNELQAITRIWRRPFIELADDNTFIDKQWSEQLCDVLEEFDLRWFTETDLSIAEHPALLRRIARSGCRQLLIGLESADQMNLQNMDRMNWKHGWFHQAQEAVRVIQDHGITVNACFILGLDGDSLESFARTLEWIDRLESCEVQITLQTAFPGTGLYRRLESEGRLDPYPFWDRCTLFDLTHEPRGMSREALASGFRELMGAVYSEERVALRRKRARSCRQSAALDSLDER